MSDVILSLRSEARDQEPRPTKDPKARPRTKAKGPRTNCYTELEATLAVCRRTHDPLQILRIEKTFGRNERRSSQIELPRRLRVGPQRPAELQEVSGDGFELRRVQV